MGRKLPREMMSVMGRRIYDRMNKLALQPSQVAAAAGVSPSTLYRIMKARKGVRTHLRTKRRLAKALRLPMAKLFGEPQLEILDEQSPPVDHCPDPIEQLILHHFDNVDPGLRLVAARAAAYTLLNMAQVVSPELRHNELQFLNPEPTQDHFEKLLFTVFRRLPPEVRRAGAKAAIRAMLNVEMVSNQLPSEQLYRAINRTNWSKKRIARNRPPL